MGIHPGCDHIGFESLQNGKSVCLRCGDEIEQKKAPPPPEPEPPRPPKKK